MKLRLPFDGAYPVTQGFGDNPGSYDYICRADKSHNGIDYGMPVGTPVLAAADGIVTRAGWDATGYGLHVRVRDGDGGGCVYGHLSALLVVSGQRVKAGEQIGYSGNTGRSTGPHLHFEQREKIEDCRTAVAPKFETAVGAVEVGEGKTRVLAESLNIRLEPGGKDVGDLTAGDEVRLAPGMGEVVQGGIRWVAVVVWAAREYLG